MTNSLIWFRQDLRLDDNPALHAALQSKQPVIPLYIHDSSSQWSPGEAGQWWLHHSLAALQKSLQARGSNLLILHGPAQSCLEQFCQQTGVSQVFWNRCYEPDAIRRDANIKRSLQASAIEVGSFNSALLLEPWHNMKQDGTPYRVFTPFWKAMQKRGIDMFSKACPKKLPALPRKLPATIDIDSLALLPDIPWHSQFSEHWQAGEAGSKLALKRFLKNSLLDYAQGRDTPALSSTSRLSPHLHFGEISPARIWREVEAWAARTSRAGSITAAEAYLRQLSWREFAHHLLYHFPHTVKAPLDERFARFPWRNRAKTDLRRWQRGQTGIPIVDAGMRELWTTGWMHNRVRMIAASLLTKNLLIPWQQGAAWFWNTLVDADLANNSMGWQWVAGSGADAAPYFRIFNPVRQGERFDANGDYVRKWVPELKALPDKWLHQPWAAPADVLAKTGIQLGKHYPAPIVDLADSRQQALAIWNDIKT